MKLLQQEITIPCPKISTLLWYGDELVDLTTGLQIGLEGSISPRSWSLGYPFNRATAIGQGETFWSVVYTNRGTKGLLMRDGQIHRELNRSHNFAHAYDYPVALAVSPA